MLESAAGKAQADRVESVGKAAPELPAMGVYQRSLLDPQTFSITWELVPGRGAFERSQDAVLSTAAQVAGNHLVHALTITDNPGGAPALSSEMLGAEIMRLGIEPLVHLTCKDKNRSELESLLYGLERAGVSNLLAMTGDYPRSGYRGAPKPVFDLDPVTLIGLIREMNQGREFATPKGVTRLKPTHFFPGAVVSPFKQLEAEQMGQYFKLKKKLEAGAGFIVSQLGYDARKQHELIQVMRLLGYGHIPVVGNIFVLPPGAAKLMNRDGLPGCVVTDKLLVEVQGESAAPDKGRARRIERAARQYALLKGMGYAGVHIAGHGMTYAELETVVGRGNELAPNWLELVQQFDFPQENGWYFFDRDSKTGLNASALAPRDDNSPAGLAYHVFRIFHHTMFEKKGVFFGPMRAIAKAVDGSSLEGAYTKCEQVIKGITNDCLHCGDCGIFDTAYLCPQSQCAKNQRNGPCGGSRDGFCEKFPGERECIYVQAYRRLKSKGEEQTLAEGVVPPVDYELYQSSSWLNFYLGRDHSAAKQGIEKVEHKPKRSKKLK
jgi:methylenetetrahydrofolate reductase (NADPH)